MISKIATALPYLQITLSVLLISVILLQQRGASVGGAFGGGEEGDTFYVRRGAEKWLFIASIVFAIFFALSAFAALFV